MYPASECEAAVAAANAAEAQEKEDRQQFDRDAEEVSRGKRDFKTVADRFTANLRREQPMVNTYNAIIQYCIRSNMDIKVLLRDSDARGALFYILNYSTKTETNVDAILNLLAPVVERIKNETDGAAEAVVAAGLVRSCSCKTIAHINLGAPAAASKVLGYSDVKISTETTSCNMWPMLKEASAAFDVATPRPASAETAEEDDQPALHDNQDSDDEEDDAIISGTSGKLRLTTRAHHLYLRRCGRDDTSHPYHGMSYVVWTRLVRVEPCSTSKKAKTSRPPAGNNATDEESDSSTHDNEPEGESIEDCFDNGSPSPAGRNRGRRASDRYAFVGLPKINKQQVSTIPFQSP